MIEFGATIQVCKESMKRFIEDVLQQMESLFTEA